MGRCGIKWDDIRKVVSNMEKARKEPFFIVCS